MENCWIGVRYISKCGQLTRRRETTIRWKEVRRMFDAYKRFFLIFRDREKYLV